MKSHLNRTTLSALLSSFVLMGCGGGGSSSESSVKTEQPQPVAEAPTPETTNDEFVSNLSFQRVASGVPFNTGQVVSPNALNSLGEIRVPVSGMSLNGKLVLSAIAADLDGIKGAWLGSSNSAKAITLCSSACGTELEAVRTGIDASQLGLSVGSNRLELLVTDQLDNTNVVDSVTFEWREDLITGLTATRNATTINVNWQGLSGYNRYNVYLNQTNSAEGQAPIAAKFLAITGNSLSISDQPATAQFSIRVTGISSGGESASSSPINIKPLSSQGNENPVAVSDSFETLEEQEVSGNVLSNDTDAEDDTLQVELPLVTEPDNGTVSIDATGNFTYLPNENFVGTDSFTYQISDGNDGLAQASVTITVTDANDAPVANDDNYTGQENQPLTVDAASGVLANDTDQEGHSLTASLGTGPVNGTVNLGSDGSFTYTPKESFSGADQFSYIVTDELDASSEATVIIEVGGVNDPPVANSDEYSVNEDETLTVGFEESILANDTDPEGDLLGVVDPLVASTTNGQLAVASDGSFTYIPDENFSGTDSFTYQVTDGELTAQATVIINVIKQDDPPLANDDSYSVEQDNSLTVTAVNGLLSNDSSPEELALTVNTTAVAAPQNGQLNLSSDGSFTYTPNTGFSGADSFTYEIEDSNGGTAQAGVSISVTEPPVDPNSAPIAGNDFLTVQAGKAHTISVLNNDSDPDGDALTVTGAQLVGSPAGVNISFNANSVSIELPTIHTDNVTATYTVSDGSLTATAQINLTVNPPQLAGVHDINNDGQTDITVTFDAVTDEYTFTFEALFDRVYVPDGLGGFTEIEAESGTFTVIVSGPDVQNPSDFTADSTQLSSFATLLAALEIDEILFEYNGKKYGVNFEGIPSNTRAHYTVYSYLDLPDDDSDGVPNTQEDTDGTSNGDDSSYIDTDGDKVPDYVETVVDGTDPNLASSFKDRDKDGVPEYVELRVYNSTGTNKDNDKIPYLYEDTDSDIVPDYYEDGTYGDDDSVKDGKDSNNNKKLDYLENFPAANQAPKFPILPSDSAEERVLYVQPLEVVDIEDEEYDYAFGDVSVTGLPAGITLTGVTEVVAGNVVGSHSPMPYIDIGMVADSKGNIYLASNNNQTIYRFVKGEGLNGVDYLEVFAGGMGEGESPDGTPLKQIKFSLLNAIAIDHNDNIYLSENNKIKKITPDGSYSTVSSDATLSSVNAIASDINGNLYLAKGGNKVYKLQPDSTLTLLANNDNVSLTDKVQNVTSLVVDTFGNLYASGDDYQSSGGAIYQFNNDNTVTVLLDTATFASTVNALHITPTNDLFIAYNSKVKKLTSGSNLLIEQTDVLSTVAGTGVIGYSGDNGTATSAQLMSPIGAYLDTQSGNIFILDSYQPKGISSIRKITGTTIKSLAGGISSLVLYPDTTHVTTHPISMVRDSQGNIYFTSPLTHSVKRIDSVGTITTIVGNGTNTNTGDGSAASSGTIFAPTGLALDEYNNLYIASFEGFVVRKITSVDKNADGKRDPVDGSETISTILGDGTQWNQVSPPANQAASATQLVKPLKLKIDNAGNLHIVHFDYGAVKSYVTTVTGGGSELSASSNTNLLENLTRNGDGFDIDLATDLAFDDNDNMVISDKGKHVVYRVNADKSVTVLAGTIDMEAYSGDGASAVSAALAAPSAITFDTVGNLYIADQGNDAIRKVDVDTGNIETLIKGRGTSLDGPIAFSYLPPIAGMDFGENRLYYYTNDEVLRAINFNHHALTGVPDTPGTYNVTISTADSLNKSSTISLSLQVGSFSQLQTSGTQVTLNMQGNGYFHASEIQGYDGQLVSFNQPSHGSISHDGNGNFVFTPPSEGYESDTNSPNIFSYKYNDNGIIREVTVTIDYKQPWRVIYPQVENHLYNGLEFINGQLLTWYTKGSNIVFIRQTADGTWHYINSNLDPLYFNAITHDGKRYYAVGNEGELKYSYNLAAWTALSPRSDENLTNIEFVNNRLVILGSNDTVLTSFDGEVWYTWNQGIVGSETITTIAYANDTYVIGSNNGKFWHRPEQGQWTTATITSGNSSEVTAIAGSPSGNFVASGKSGQVWMSNGGQNWVGQGGSSDKTDVVYANGDFYIVEGDSTYTNGAILTLADGFDTGSTITLNSVSMSPLPEPIYGLAYNSTDQKLYFRLNPYGTATGILAAATPAQLSQVTPELTYLNEHHDIAFTQIATDTDNRLLVVGKRDKSVLINTNQTTVYEGVTLETSDAGSNWALNIIEYDENAATPDLDTSFHSIAWKVEKDGSDNITTSEVIIAGNQELQSINYLDTSPAWSAMSDIDFSSTFANGLNALFWAKNQNKYFAGEDAVSSAQVWESTNPTAWTAVSGFSSVFDSINGFSENADGELVVIGNQAKYTYFEPDGGTWDSANIPAVPTDIVFDPVTQDFVTSSNASASDAIFGGATGFAWSNLVTSGSSNSNFTYDMKTVALLGGDEIFVAGSQNQAGRLLFNISGNSFKDDNITAPHSADIKDAVKLGNYIYVITADNRVFKKYLVPIANLTDH